MKKELKNVWLSVSIIAVTFLTGCVSNESAPSQENHLTETLTTIQEVMSSNSEDLSASSLNSIQTTVSSSKEYYPASYVINTNTCIFHCPNCSSVMKANPEVIQHVESTCADLIERGYSPCQKCHPQDIEISDGNNIPVESKLTPDEDADNILKRYNNITELDKITENDVSCETTAGGYHTTAIKNGIQFELCYADSFYLQAMASNQNASKEVFRNEVVNFLASIIGSSAESLITECLQTGNSVTYNKQTITFNGSYFRYSDDSWAY